MQSMDWVSFMAELQGFGLSQQEIAEWCGCGQSTISDLARGDAKDPRDSLGQRLRTLMLMKRAERAAAAEAAAASAQRTLPLMAPAAAAAAGVAT